jgi:hypothetical protein
MTDTTHTQGPWATYVDSAHDGWIVCADGNLIACAVRNENMQANAKLIAAAPDLLSALENLTVLFDRMDRSGATNKAAYNDAIAAIAKAKGA